MKAILTIDEMPNKCEDCPFVATLRLSSTPISMCYVIKRPEVSADLEEGRPCWCPLKEMPRELDANDWHRMFDGLFSEREAKGYGWNACLEELEK